MPAMHRDAKAEKRAALLAKVNRLQGEEASVFGTIIEHVGPLKEWPTKEFEWMMSDRLTSQPRLWLSLFLLNLGSPPEKMADWYMMRGMLRDQSAHLDVAGIIKKHLNDELGKYSTYVLPSKLTAADKAVEDRAHPWDGVGDPVPRYAAFGYFDVPVSGPADGGGRERWRWLLAQGMLMSMDRNAGAVMGSRRVQQEIEIKIVPMQEEQDSNWKYLTDSEKSYLLELGRYGSNTSEATWNLACDDIKAARNGRYPDDWYYQIIVGALYA